ncbi:MULTISPECIES: hypothetical protein [Acidiplasma]|jgi:hypothetical protein|nr:MULTISPECIES: hypothetical protein [Acidiplasma]KQB34763.1 hypothetical protein AOG54_00615 [Acidiplasma aeolicum]WMT55701.1 MAG: hypothetical protein RE470_03400 [Acidiplasma sp.]
MTLIVMGILHHLNLNTSIEHASENFVYVSKKILQMYSIKSGCVVNGKLVEINPATDNPTEVAMPDLSSITGLKVGMLYYVGEGEKDYLFFPLKTWNKLVDFAIFPEEYELKFEFYNVACKFRKYNLFNKGTVIDKEDRGNGGSL